MKEEELFDKISLDSISDEEPITIYAHRKNLREIIKKIGYAIDNEGYIVFKDTNERIISFDGGELKLKEVGLIMPANSPHVFVKNNLGSLSKYLAEKE